MAVEKKKKKGDKQETFRPGTEKRDIFCLTLSIIAELLNKKKIELKVNSSGDAEFTIVASEIQDYVTEKIKDQISFENFMTTIPTEIESLIMASFFSDTTKGVQKNIPSTIIKDVGINEFLWRIEEINKVLAIHKDLKQEVIFRKTSKGLLLKDIKWAKDCKTCDDEFGKLDNIEYATLSILYSQPTTESGNYRLISEGFSLQLPTISEPKQITLELHKKDVTKLIDNLQQILEKF
jgi:hypothetical protein